MRMASTRADPRGRPGWDRVASFRLPAGALMSKRALVVVLLIGYLAVGGAAVVLERQLERQVHDALVAEAELIVHTTVEVDLPATTRVGLTAAQRSRLDSAVDHLKDEGHLEGLHLYDERGRLLWADIAEPEPLSTDETARLDRVRGGEPQVLFEHEEGRARSATVLVAFDPAEDGEGGEGGETAQVAEVLLPQQQAAHQLHLVRRGVYAAVALFLVLLSGVMVLGRRRMLQREHEATHDPLTRLGNRAMLAAAFRQVPDRSAADGDIALLMLDLDGFKVINDTLGHPVGDHLLVSVATALRKAVRPDDLVVRLGGDEFAVMLTNLRDTAAALTVAAHVHAALQQPHDLAGVTLEVGASIGVVASTSTSFTLPDLMRCADVAMYKAKQDGGGVRLYDEADDPHDVEQLGLLADLRRAITAGELRLLYQPKVTARGRRTVGFEALVRWEHPRRGLLAPDVFIPLAEKTALLWPLTAWVLANALQDCARWRAAGWDVGVAVNIAPSTLLDPGLPGAVLAALAEVGLPGQALELEITETAVMVDPSRAATTLSHLRAMGVAVAIDDFGAGYTSLSYLKTLPVCSLKIDRGFITHLLEDSKDAAVARSVISLGHELGLTVVAEGVESEAVCGRLRELGCDELQGYHLARPMDPTHILGWLTTTRDDAQGDGSTLEPGDPGAPDKSPSTQPV